MPKGRKEEQKNVVPLTGDDDGQAFERHRKAAVEKADRLKPARMPKQVQVVWDREAPRFTHATVNRLNEHSVTAFRCLCEALARYEKAYRSYTRKGMTYTPGEGRNGKQRRHLPEFAQMNTFLKQAIELGGKFGWTPQDERGLSAEGQRELPLGNDFN